ncbi:MAG TPA: hypothetical protein VFB90_05895 [Dehalococcoidia bacterium]|nr:hypothetical protein [Dehalococcoidia bacterium]
MKAQQRYWEDVSEGEELANFQIEINARRAYLDVSGSQDWYPPHHDAEFARKAGHAGIFMTTGFTQAALVRVLTDWMGDEGFLKRLSFEMRRQQRPGDTMTCRGRVTRKYIEDGRHYVDCEVWAESEREGMTTPGRAVVALPSRESAG